MNIQIELDKKIRDRMYEFATTNSDEQVSQAAETYDAALSAVLDWATGMEHDFMGEPSAYGLAIATEVRSRIAKAMEIGGYPS